MVQLDEHATSEVRRHASVIVATVLVLIAAASLIVRSDERIALRWWPSWPAPETCLSRTWLHIDCPACGLTRSFVLLAAGQFAESIQRHRWGWLVVVFVAGQIPYRILRVKAIVTTGITQLSTPWPKRCTLAVVAVLILNWIVKLCGW